MTKKGESGLGHLFFFYFIPLFTIKKNFMPHNECMFKNEIEWFL